MKNKVDSQLETSIKLGKILANSSTVSKEGPSLL